MIKNLVTPAHKNVSLSEAATGGVLWKKVFLEISRSSQENTCASLFIKKEVLAQVWSWEFCEISKSAFLHRTPLLAASALWSINSNKIKLTLKEKRLKCKELISRIKKAGRN